MRASKKVAFGSVHIPDDNLQSAIANDAMIKRGR